MTVLLQLGRKTLLLWPWGDWVDWLAEKLGQRHFLLSNEVKSLELQLSGDGARKNIMDLNELAAEYPEYARKYNTDIFVYTGPIFYSPASDFVDSVIKMTARKESCLLYLTTPGGDPHAAYRIIRTLRSQYKKVILGVVGPCKSAGTLISLGAHELLMSECGELGPLDVQLAKPDELMSNSSGLDIIEALAVTTQSAFEVLEQRMFELVEHSSGAISTKTAAEISSSFAVELFKPIMAQIEPDRLGEVQRAIKIAQAYGEKLGTPNLKPGSLQKLVDGYPSHGFVIDFEEARTLYKSVKKPTGYEVEFSNVFKSVLRHIKPATNHFSAEEAFTKIIAGNNGTKPNGKQPSQPDISTGNGKGTNNQPEPRKAASKRPVRNDKGVVPVRKGKALNGAARP